jgi:uncharacterized membrane protein
MAVEQAKAGSGLPKNTAAALSYVLGPITGVVFFVIDKDPFVRFHAMQSIVVFVVLFVLQWVLGFTLILLPLVPLVSIFAFILWLVLIYKAWQGDEWEVPVLGNIARQMLGKV